MSLSKGVLIGVLEACLGGSLPLSFPYAAFLAAQKLPFLQPTIFCLQSDSNTVVRSQTTFTILIAHSNISTGTRVGLEREAIPAKLRLQTPKKMGL